jgi:hypothetical protein
VHGLVAEYQDNHSYHSLQAMSHLDSRVSHSDGYPQENYLMRLPLWLCPSHCDTPGKYHVAQQNGICGIGEVHGIAEREAVKYHPTL